jgi:hypothetical protein
MLGVPGEVVAMARRTVFVLAGVSAGLLATATALRLFFDGPADRVASVLGILAGAGIVGAGIGSAFAAAHADT